MSQNDSLFDAMTEYVQRCEPMLAEDTTVVGFMDDTESDGCCETCYYERVVVRMELSDGGTHTYYGSFSELIWELT